MSAEFWQDIASEGTDALVTSSGISTREARTAFRTMIDTAQPRQGGRLRILRITDGLEPFAPEDPITRTDRILHHLEAKFIRWWSDKCLAYAAGKGHVEVLPLSVSGLSSEAVRSLAQTANVLELPAGNTPNLAKAVQRHVDTLVPLVETQNLAVITASAGSIVASSSLEGCAVPPADVLAESIAELSPLGILEVPVMVHAPGRRVPLPAGGMLHHLVSSGFRDYESKPGDQANFIARHPNAVCLNDANSLLVTRGHGRLVRPQSALMPGIAWPLPQE